MTIARSLVLIFVSLIIRNEAARILAVFPAPSISHQAVFRPLILELLRLGHEIVMVTTDPMYKKGEGLTNLTELDVHDISYKIMREEYTLTTTTNKGTLEQWSAGYKVAEKLGEAQFSTSEVQALLNDETKSFDLLLVESLYVFLLGLTAVYKAPLIQVSSFGSTNFNLEAVGAPIHPLLYPGIIQTRARSLTLWDKISELYLHFRVENIVATYEKNTEDSMKRVFGKNLPPLSELKDNIDMLFLNIHPIWENNRPVPPNVIFMGGLHQKPERKLPQDLQDYLDSSKHGVIYISFGTNVEPALLPPEKLQALINAFSKTPYDILWKWNKGVLPGKTENIKISKWLPQSDLLRHPKIKLFITQGGLQSTDEAITAGVPLIGIPMLGDQWLNVDHYVQHKIGLRLDMQTITEEAVFNAIQTIVNDNSFRHNIEHLRSVMLDQPQTPLERATWWIEYVLRHGGAKHLRSPAANMPWTEYVELELISYLVLGLLLVLGIFAYMVHFLYNLYNANSKLKPKLKSK